MLLFCCQVMSNTLWPHGLQQARLPCLSPSPRVCPLNFPFQNFPSIQWCHPTMSSSVTLFSFKRKGSSYLQEDPYKYQQFLKNLFLVTRDWHNIYKVMKGKKNLQPTLLCPGKTYCNHSVVSLHTCHHGCHEKGNIKCCPRRGEKGIFVHCWWDCKLAELLWMWNFL